MSDADSDDGEMRKAMGFSSFGSSQRTKKEPKESSAAVGESSASGANSAPIAKRMKTNSNANQLAPFSTLPPTFWPASLLPPKSAASTTSSTQSYTTAIEQDQQQQKTVYPESSSRQDPTSAYILPPGAMQNLQYSHPLPPPPGVGLTGPAQNFLSTPLPPPGPPAYTNPDSGISFTRQELNELRRGRVNERGDLVFFQPGFVEEDPWARLRR